MNIIFHIKEGNLEHVKQCIDQGVSVNHLGMWGNTPLIVACQYQKTEIAEYLLTMKEVDIHHINEKQASALVYACLEGATE